jgi:2-dehydropantoate 2-reductase
MIDSDTWVLSVQNGVDSAERLAEIVGEDHVIGAVAQVSAQLTEPGEITQMAGPGKLIIGERSGGASLRAAQIAQAFEQAGVPSAAHPQIRNAIWEKFLLICGLSGITALTRLPMGSVLGCPESKALFCDIMTEVEAVARANAIALQDGCVHQTIALFASLSPALRGSMAHDLAAGRRLELEALNGMVVALGRKHGVATPVNDVVYAALKPYAGGPPVIP